MAFLETPRFPDDIKRDPRGGPAYNTEVVVVDSGHEKASGRWQYPKHRYSVLYGAKQVEAIYNVYEHFHAVKGRLHRFRYKDWFDYKSTDDMDAAVSDTDQTLGTGDASETDFQLIKTYPKGALSGTRKISKPVSGTVVVSLDDVGQGSGWSVDTTTGIVTFTSPPGNGVVVKAGYEFDVPVRFDSDFLEIELISKVVQDLQVLLVEVPL